MKLYKLLPILTICFSFLQMHVNGQDYIFSQTEASHIYLNPASAGYTNFVGGSILQRLQWPSESKTSSATLATLDYSLNDNSAFAFVGVSGYDFPSKFLQNNIGIVYSHTVSVNDKASFSAGLKASVLHIGLSDRYIFGDQFNENGLLNGTETSEELENRTIISPDFATGLLFKYDKKLRIGISASHLSRPNVSLSSGDAKYSLPINWGAEASYRIYIDENPNRLSYIKPFFYYNKQSTFQQCKLGAYYLILPILVGAFYNGVPFDSYQDITQHQSVSIALGLRFQLLKLEYTYDIDLSAISKTGGAHEISIYYEVFNDKRSTGW